MVTLLEDSGIIAAYKILEWLHNPHSNFLYATHSEDDTNKKTDRRIIKWRKSNTTPERIARLMDYLDEEL